MFRDIHQLREAPPYGIVALEGLSTAEAALEAATSYVPYCPEHLDVWSPKFAQIILECASQIDSLWKAVEKTRNPDLSDERRTIEDHFAAYGSLVATQKVVFFGGPSHAVIQPFSSWTSSTYRPLLWWQSYNKLKHDRFSNQCDATLSHALESVAALLLAIIYSGACDLALMSAQMLDTSEMN